MAERCLTPRGTFVALSAAIYLGTSSTTTSSSSASASASGGGIADKTGRDFWCSSKSLGQLLFMPFEVEVELACERVRVRARAGHTRSTRIDGKCIYSTTFLLYTQFFSYSFRRKRDIVFSRTVKSVYYSDAFFIYWQKWYLS